MIAIIDDLFPWKGSGFRFTEYDYYLKRSEVVSVFSNLSSLGFVGKMIEKPNILAEVNYGSKFQVIEDFAKIPKMNGYYCLFLNNVSSIVKLAERDNVPFAFTLYPGGGFEIGNEEVYEIKKNY